LTGGCSGILARFHEAEGLDILCHLMVELIELKLESRRVGGFGHYIQIYRREFVPGSCKQLPAGLMGQGIVTINDAC